MFPGPVNSWDKNKLELAQWGLFYKSLSERPEEDCPPKKIWEKLLDYDIMLDEYLEQERWKKKQKLEHTAENAQEIYRRY